MAGEPAGDLKAGRLLDPVPRIAGQAGTRGARQRPTGPGPPAALLAARRVHAPGVMLEVDPRIARPSLGRSLPEDPVDGGVGQRPGREHRLVAAQPGAQRAVQAEDRARRQSSAPERLGVLQAGEVKGRAARGRPVGVQRAPIEPGPGRGEVGARGKHGVPK